MPLVAPQLGFNLVFDTADGYANAHVWIARKAGTRAVASAKGSLVTPVPAPDGRSLLVERLDSDGNGGQQDQLEIITLAGKVTMELPHSGGCIPGGWAGTHTVIAGCGDGRNPPWHVVRFDLNNHATKVIATEDPGDAPSVSPDGTLVAYGDEQSMWVMPSTGGKSTLLLPVSEQGAWAPDGKHLAIPGHTAAGSNALFLVNADGSGHKKLVDISVEALGATTTYSPDGKHILVAGSGDVAFPISEVDVDGRHYHELVPQIVGGDPHPLP